METRTNIMFFFLNMLSEYKLSFLKFSEKEDSKEICCCVGSAVSVFLLDPRVMQRFWSVATFRKKEDLRPTDILYISPTTDRQFFFSELWLVIRGDKFERDYNYKTCIFSKFHPTIISAKENLIFATLRFELESFGVQAPALFPITPNRLIAQVGCTLKYDSYDTDYSWQNEAFNLCGQRKWLAPDPRFIGLNL